MLCFWISLSLLCILLHRVSADEGVKLNCNTTVKVQFGHAVTLNCSINWTQRGQNCKGTKFHWRHADDDTHDGISCTSDNYSCESDNITYVSLTILNVSKKENYTVGMSSNCGMDISPSITVQLDETPPLQEPATNKTQQNEETPSPVTAIVLGVLAAATVVAVLCFLFKRVHASNEQSLLNRVQTLCMKQSEEQGAGFDQSS